MSGFPRYTRLVVSYVAAAVAAGWCSALGDFHIDFFDLQSWMNAFTYTSGRVLIVLAAWGVLEMLLALAFPMERDTMLEPSHA